MRGHSGLLPLQLGRGEQLTRRAPGAGCGQGRGHQRPPALASGLCPGGRERATRQGPAAAAPPSPALSALRGADAAAASSAPAPPPASRKSPRRTGAPVSAGGKTRDS